MVTRNERSRGFFLSDSVTSANWVKHMLAFNACLLLAAT